MASFEVCERSYSIRDLETRGVTFFPQNAQVVRVLEDIELEPGLNRIEIVGLSPTVDEGSIKVDGHGKASISGLTVESIRNPEHFRDVYDSDSEDDLDQPDARRLPPKPQKLQTLEERVHKMQADIQLLNEEIGAAENGIQIVQQLTRTVGKENLSATEISNRVEKCQETIQRQALQVVKAREKKYPLEEELPKLTLDMEAANRAYLRDTKNQRKESERAEAKWKRTREARRKTRQERVAERAKFWPRKVYKITVTVERLADIHDKSELASEQDEECISLSLYYVTGEAFWTPAYDISIASESQSGALVYRAEVSNNTSETWQNAELTLSTSQTSFKGLRDPIPELIPWHLRLFRNKATPSVSALISTQERNSRLPTSRGQAANTRRSENFGVPLDENPQLQFDDLHVEQKKSLVSTASFASPGAVPPLGAASLFGSARPTSSLAETQGVRGPAVVPSGALFGGAKSEAFGTGSSQDKLDSSFVPMSIPEAAWEESGLTAVWDLDGRHTIIPSSKRHRHRIATIELADLELKHECVPKLRSDAFLTMRLHNPSDQTILAGEAGLTLDGAFLGTTDLKRIAPGESTTVSLGVDDSIVVEYAQPTEKRNLTSGLINKDACTGFQRCVTLRHTKSPEGGKARPVEITVRDQIPIPMDERIRLELAKPNGLRAIGDAVRAGEGVKDETTTGGRTENRGSVSNAGSMRSGGKHEESWGRAMATLNKDGKIEWKVHLNPGHKVALPLEYDLRFPAGDSVHGD